MSKDKIRAKVYIATPQEPYTTVITLLSCMSSPSGICYTGCIPGKVSVGWLHFSGQRFARAITDATQLQAFTSINTAA